MLEFTKITIEAGAVLKKYLQRKGQYACEFTFGNNMLWNVDGLLEYVIVDEILIYRLLYPDRTIYCIPDFHNRIKEILDRISADAECCGKDYFITCLNSGMMEQIKQVYPDRYGFDVDPAHSDYIYSVEKLASLSGKKLHKKKNHLNQFIRNQDFVYETVSGRNIADCRRMKEKWFENRLRVIEHEESAQEEKKSLLWERTAIDTAFDHFKEFDFTGGLIRIDGEVSAFTLGEPVNDEMFVVHFEKAFSDVNGLYTAINQQFVEHELLGRYRYVNREEDMGLEGLRQAKMSYYPEFIYEKWVAFPVTNSKRK